MKYNIIDKIENRGVVFLVLTVLYLIVFSGTAANGHPVASLLGLAYPVAVFFLWRSKNKVVLELWQCFETQAHSAEQEQERRQAFTDGFFDAQTGEPRRSHDKSHYTYEGSYKFYTDGYAQAYESHASIKQRLEEAAFDRMCDTGQFPTRKDYLAFCRKEAEEIRQAERPYVRLVRGPDFEWLKGSPDKKGPACGLVMLVRTKKRRRGDRGPYLQVGASFCHPSEAHRFNRHEALLKAHKRLVWVPEDLDPELDICSDLVAEFYEQFPKSCRPMIQTMLNQARIGRVLRT